MAEEVAARGSSAVTVARVIARAGVSRRLYYELFADVEDCFLASFDWAVEEARARVLAACAGERVWREEIRAGLAALLRFFDDHPLFAQLCIVHAPGGGPRVLDRRAQVIAELCSAVDLGRSDRSATREQPPVVAEGVVGAVIAVLYTRLLARGGGGDGGYRLPGLDEPPLIELHGQLVSLVVLPYLGASAAGRELSRPAPPPLPAASPRVAPAARAIPHAPSGRITYRTVCVLRAIAERPAASNREIAERAGIIDQGQISKVLSRLEDQGLIVNRGGSTPARGTPNAWWLTEAGEALELQLRERPTARRVAERQPGKGSGSRRPGM